jgi:hypothetical protein
MNISAKFGQCEWCGSYVALVPIKESEMVQYQLSEDGLPLVPLTRTHIDCPERPTIILHRSLKEAK